MKELLEKEFVSAKRVGRTKRIETTPKFKEYFEVK
jgi:chromosome segregation and condensation protein ScpB